MLIGFSITKTIQRAWGTPMASWNPTEFWNKDLPTWEKKQYVVGWKNGAFLGIFHGSWLGDFIRTRAGMYQDLYALTNYVALLEKEVCRMTSTTKLLLIVNDKKNQIWGPSPWFYVANQLYWSCETLRKGSPSQKVSLTWYRGRVLVIFVHPDALTAKVGFMGDISVLTKVLRDL